MTTYPRNGSASAGKLLLNTPKIPRHRNLVCNSPTLLSNIETRTLIFRGFQGVIQETRWGITCEIWGGLSGTCGYRRDRRGRQVLPGHAIVERTPTAAPTHRDAQNADHLCQNHQNTAIVAEVVYVLGRLPVRAIHTSTRLPTPPRRHDAGPTDRDAHASTADGSHPDRLRRYG